MTTRLLLVDDHAVVRSGLRMLLEDESDMEIVGEAESASEAIANAIRLKPNVILMDIGLPDMSGIEATREIKKRVPDAAIVALTIHEDEEYFFKMLEAGASGYVPKRAAPDELLTAIHAAANRQVYLYPSLAKLLVRDYLGGGRPSEEQSASELTDREQEVLTYLAEGANNEEIAAALVISPKTVARHRENIMRKLNLHSRAELVRYAIRKGIIKA
ncbi:MAG: DNA-binding response regulator [Anaerolineales bacterium]|nr:response regulator transcription factor [Anaerolineae bacterium]PWB74432.1 MAG: DNA-binding response regulator [Anaerolineales bacterium]